MHEIIFFPQSAFACRAGAPSQAEDFEFIRCQREQILLDADSSLDHVFFPESGVVSVVALYADGNIIEMATIGGEGCTGVQAVFGSKTSSARLLVQIPGGAAKMSRAAFDRAMKSMPSFRGLMFAYVQAFLEQVLVSVAAIYSITSSAVASSAVGIVRASILAVLRLMTKSNLVGCKTGNSAGLAPPKILPL